MHVCVAAGQVVYFDNHSQRKVLSSIHIVNKPIVGKKGKNKLFPLNLLFLGTISINTLRTAYTAPGESEILDLDENLYLGGLPENKMGLVFPTEVWTALLNYGYVGCIRDLFIDGQSKDVRRLAEIQRAAGVKPSCSKEPPKQCLSNPCQNNGVCREGWNRYVCDCSGTGYLGRSCERGRTLFFVSFHLLFGRAFLSAGHNLDLSV